MPLRETPLSLWPGEKRACVCTGCVTKPNHTGKGSLKQHWENSTRAAMFSESSEHKTVLFKCTVQTDCCIPMAANKTRCSLPGFRFTLFKNKIKTTPEVPFVYRRASLKLHPEKQPKNNPLCLLFLMLPLQFSRSYYTVYIIRAALGVRFTSDTTNYV